MAQLLLEGFSHQFQLMVFRCSLSNRRSPQVSRTLLRILAVLHNVVVWMVFTYPLISMSSSSFKRFLVTVPKAPITIGIFVTFMFHYFLKFPSKVQVLILLFSFFQFYSVVSWDHCDGKFFKIPKTGLYFFTCEDGVGWHLISCRISPRSEFFPRAHKNWHIMWGINLGLDWPPLARGSKFHIVHTPTKATRLPP